MLKEEEIKHVANLAKLDVSKEEVVEYTKELSDVVEYFDQLKEVDVKGVEPTAQVTGLVNQTRSDKVKDWDKEERENSLQNNLDKETNKLGVSKILNS